MVSKGTIATHIIIRDINRTEFVASLFRLSDYKTNDWRTEHTDSVLLVYIIETCLHKNDTICVILQKLLTKKIKIL